MLWRASSMLDLTDCNAAVEPLENALDALDVTVVIKPMALGRATRHDQPVTTFPSPQGDWIDSSKACYLPDRKPAVVTAEIDLIINSQGHV